MNRVKALFLATALAATLGGGWAWAAELHVAPGGDDRGPGTAARPLATLQAAVEAARPGEVITVHAGAYAGCRIEGSGRDDAWITLQAAPGQRVVVDRPGPANRHGSNMEVETWSGDRTVAYWIIRGLELTGAPGAGVDLRGQRDAHNHHLRVEDCLLHHNGNSGVFTAFCDDLAIRGNTSRHNGEHGIYCSNSGDRPVVEQNLCHHNGACGVQLNGDASMGGDGMISRAVVADNILYQNGAERGGAAVNLDGVSHSRITGNTIFANLAGGLALYRAGGAEASHHNLISGNLVRMPPGSRWAVNLADPGCVHNTIRDNLLYHADPGKGAVRLPRPEMEGLVCRDNLVSARFSLNGGRSLVGLEAWREHGYGQGSRAVTPEELPPAPRPHQAAEPRP
jgi:hypothetical protein